jgi:ketosteroid isomerase-like protein
LDDQVEWHEPDGFGPPLAGTHQGPTAVVRDVFGQLETRWPGYQLVPAEYLESGDQVIVLGHALLPDGLAEPVGAGFAHVWRIRDGRIVDVRVFTDTATALRHTA